MRRAPRGESTRHTPTTPAARSGTDHWTRACACSRRTRHHCHRARRRLRCGRSRRSSCRDSSRRRRRNSAPCRWASRMRRDMSRLRTSDRHRRRRSKSRSRTTDCCCTACLPRAVRFQLAPRRLLRRGRLRPLRLTAFHGPRAPHRFRSRSRRRLPLRRLVPNQLVPLRRFQRGPRSSPPHPCLRS
jgi:hypothetical protein